MAAHPQLRELVLGFAFGLGLELDALAHGIPLVVAVDDDEPLILERDISAPADAPWENQSPQGSQGLIGVCLTEQGGYAVGQFGYIARRDATGWRTEDAGLPPDADNRSLHSVWVDPDGGVWAVGGQVLVEPLVDGWLLHKGASVPAVEME